MEEERNTKGLRKIYLYFGIGALFLYGLLMVFVFPWWQASNHPVVLTLGAPIEANLELRFDGKQSVPLVAIGEAGNYHWYWGTELPARRNYDLALHFPDGTSGGVVLSEVKVLTLSPERKETVLDLSELPTLVADGIKVVEASNGWVISAQPDASLVLPSTFTHRSFFHWISDWVSASFIFVIYGLFVLFLLTLALRFPDTITFRERQISPRETQWMIGTLVIGMLFHLYLVGNSIPDYWPADSTSYTMKAVSLATEGSYDTGTHEYELNRMPGFPVFMALIFELAGWNLHAVTIAQAVLFCAAIFIFAWILRPFAAGQLLGLFGLFAMISPPAIWASRQIATESTFASMWILAMAAFIFLWRQSGGARWGGWVLFGICSTAALAIRPNGILLLALPGFLFVGATWWAIGIRGSAFWKMPIFWSTATQVAIPCSIVLVFLVAWSWRNYESRGYPKPTDLTEVVWANAPFFAGLLDLRAADDLDEMNWMVNERANVSYWFHGWSLRKYRFRKLTDDYQNIEDRSIADLEQEMADFNKASDALIPFPAKLMGWGRVATWGLFFPAISAHTMDPLNQNYAVAVDFPNEKQKAHIRKNLAWATRNVDREISLHPVTKYTIIDFYNWALASRYIWLYRGLLCAAMIGCLLSMAEGKYLAAVLFAPYLLNVLLNVYFMYIIGRYVQVLDASLWMTALMGFGCVAYGTFQQSVSEKDRKWLLSKNKTRYHYKRSGNVSGTPQ